MRARTHVNNQVRCLALMAAAVGWAFVVAPAIMAIEVGQVADFEDGTIQGWTEAGRSPNPPRNVAIGGNPGSFLRNESSGRGSAGSRWVMFNTDDWVGDFITANVTAIQMDLKNLSAVADSLSMRVSLEGAGATRFGSSQPFALPKDDQWHTATFGLTTDEMTRIGGAMDLNTVLSDVGTIRLLAAEAGPAWIGDQVAAIVGVDNIMAMGPALELPELQAGDADRDLDFDQLDLVKVQIASKYLTGQPATWGEGDWNGAPGGNANEPPAGDGVFNQFDIVAAQIAAVYLTGPYAAVAPNGVRQDLQTSIVYDPATGELAVDAPAGLELTSINIDSAAGIFTASPAANLGGSFDNDADTNIFKATFGDSFGSLSFGSVAQTGLSEQFLVNDLTVVGSLSGGGDLGDVDLIYVPEPCSLQLSMLGLLALWMARRKNE